MSKHFANGVEIRSIDQIKREAYETITLGLFMSKSTDTLKQISVYRFTISYLEFWIEVYEHEHLDFTALETMRADLYQQILALENELKG